MRYVFEVVVCKINVDIIVEVLLNGTVYNLHSSDIVRWDYPVPTVNSVSDVGLNLVKYFDPF